MSLANTPNIQIITDNMQITVVKVTAFFNATALNSNTIVVAANTLTWANSHKPCVLSLVGCTYQCSLGTNGLASLQWVGGGSATNTDIVVLGGSSGGDFNYLMSNPLAANTANLNGLAGDINLQISNPVGNSSLTLFLSINKEGGAGGGYANGYVGYNDNTFPGG